MCVVGFFGACSEKKTAKADPTGHSFKREKEDVASFFIGFTHAEIGPQERRSKHK